MCYLHVLMVGYVMYHVRWCDFRIEYVIQLFLSL